MIAALALAAAMQPDIYEKDGCRWIRPAQAAKAPHPASGAAPARAKPRSAAPPALGKPARKPKAAPRDPADELIGCDEDGPVFRSDIASVEFWPEETPPVRIDRVEPTIPPDTFAEACDCSTSAPGMPTWPGAVGGPILRPIHPLAPIPEAPVWLAMLAGLALIIRKAA